MKWLATERLLVLFKIKIRKKQGVKRDLAKCGLPDWRVPSDFGTSVNARIQSAERRFVLIRDQCFEYIEHKRTPMNAHTLSERCCRRT
jgi:hypothetical protein